MRARATQEIAGIVATEDDAERRCATVMIGGVVVVHTANDEVELKVNGQRLQVTLAQARSIAAAVLALRAALVEPDGE